jgi:outer membrane protein assembly factor BamB
MKFMVGARTSLVLALVVTIAIPAAAEDWPEWRGPRRDGSSREKGLPEKWSTSGENLLWRAPIGGRSAPVVFGDRVYLFTASGKGEMLQEQLNCLDAITGKVLWQRRMNVFLSDVPPHRAAWASPGVDPETGNVYAFGVGGMLYAFTRDGKPVWEKSLVEEYGLVTTHGGRTTSPVIDGEMVIVSGISTGWGAQAKPAHRFFAFNKKNGSLIWAGETTGRPYDTTYAPPLIGEVDGMRLLISGAGDGATYAIKLGTGEVVWKYEMSKRGINSGVVVNNNTVIVSHREENLDTNEMGLLAGIDIRSRGIVAKEQLRFRITGWQGGVSSPVLDGDRVYQVDNGSNLFAFDAYTGRTLWQLSLGTIQKGSLLMADGKLYVGTENGKFFILRPRTDRCEVLSEVALGTPEAPEAIIASPAISNGRLFVTSMEATYAIGSKTPGKPSPAPARAAATPGKPAWLQVVPAEVLLKPGETAKFTARLFDDRGNLIKETPAEWTASNTDVTITAGTLKAGQRASAGIVKATAEGITGEARFRVIPPPPIEENFDTLTAAPAHWINAAGKTAVRDLEGSKVLVKLADNPFTKRARIYIGPASLSAYTVEADVRMVDKRRQMGDAGIVAQRYQLTLFGNNQKLELQSWQPDTSRTVVQSYAIKGDTWYRLKLRVEPAGDGKVRALGKAWKKDEAEPAEWMIQRVDPTPNLQGAPGLYADAPNEVYFDNLKVTPNR